ncbi:MAG: hypothetical protein KF777_13620 [Planctomycetaceae bacterium]|nr:hypothetical protein [Planctomycetaceae bacterium]
MSVQGVRAGRAYVEIGGDDSSLDRVLREDVGKLRNFASSVARVSGAVLAVGAAGATSLVPAISKASEYEQTMAKFDTIFGDLADSNRAWGDETAKQLGRSRQQIASFLADTQTLLLPIGFEPGAAEQMSRTLTTLASDMGSFHNKADSDVMRDLHAALTGSGEVMKKYGVIVTEAAVKQELLNAGMRPDRATEMEKVWARYNIIMRGTVSAQGDTLRSMNTFDNQMKSFTASVDDLQVAFGTHLLPILTPLVTKASTAIQATAEWTAKNGDLAESVIALVAGLISTGGAGLAVAGIVRLMAGVWNSYRLVLQATTRANVILQALSGPKGWAMIAAGLGVAAVAIAGVNAALKTVEPDLAKAEEGLKGFAEAQTQAANAPPVRLNVPAGPNIAALLEKSLTPAMKLRKELEELAKARQWMGDFGHTNEAAAMFQRLSDSAYDSATGIQSAMQKAREEIALLKGTITEGELELHKMAANGASQQMLDQYRQLMQERDRLKSEQEAKDRARQEAEQRRQSVIQTARNEAQSIVSNTRTDEERRDAELARLKQLRNTVDPSTGRAFLDEDTYQRAVQKVLEGAKPDAVAVDDRLQRATASDVRSEDGARALLAAFGGGSSQDKLLKSSQLAAAEATKQTELLAKIERKPQPETESL